MEEWLFSFRRLFGEPSEGKNDAQSFKESKHKEERTWKKCADQNPGYKVFDAGGKVVYEPKAAEPAVKVPFLVRVSVPDLNIRTGPGTDYPRTGMFTGIGTFTIVEVKKGKGSSEGWGRLKSGAGWIALSLVKRV